MAISGTRQLSTNTNEAAARRDRGEHAQQQERIFRRHVADLLERHQNDDDAGDSTTSNSITSMRTLLR